MTKSIYVVAALLVLVAPRFAGADETTIYERDGVTYRETRRIVRRPYSETRLEPRDRLVYRQEYHTDYRDSHRTAFIPVTEYQLEPRLRGVLNPFVLPHIEYVYAPRTRWEARAEIVSVPTIRKELVAETRTEQVPVTVMGMRDEEVITRVPVSNRLASGRSTSPSSTTRTAMRIGGVAQLDNDPPRQSSGSDWRASDATLRR